MQLNVEQYEILMELRNIAFTHKDDLTSYEINIVNKADNALAEIFVKHQKMNKKTAEYIAKKRTLDKNYARTPYQKKKGKTQ